jgi:hypothetical protein
MLTGFDAGVSESFFYRFDNEFSEKMSARRIRVMSRYGMSASEGGHYSWEGQPA